FRGTTLFGGFLLGQAVYAAGLTAPADRRIHSLHAYFLRPAVAGLPLLHEVETVRDGRAFAVRRLKTRQAGKVVLEMSCSYTSAGEEIDYGEPLGGDVPDPEGRPRLSDWGGPYDVVRVGPGGGETS